MARGVVFAGRPSQRNRVSRQKNLDDRGGFCFFRTRAIVVEGDRLRTLAIPLRGIDDLGKALL